MRVPIEQVPIKDRRRAARLLMSLLISSEENQDLTSAHFGQEVTPLYRPDVDGIAYWEFEIEGISTVMPSSDGDVTGFDRGFLIISTGTHDVPIPHFSLDLAPPSRRLELFDQPIERIIKLDSLCYAAEDARGQLIGHIGTMPPKLEVLPPTPGRTHLGWATTLSRSKGVGRAADDKDDSFRKSPTRKSREQRPIRARQWESWEETKRGYRESYDTMLGALAERAEHPWKMEELTEKFGQGIRSGETLSLPMLGDGRFTVSGAGSKFVRAERKSHKFQPRLLLAPEASIDEDDLSFDVTFKYGAEEEKLSFFIVPADAPTTIVPQRSTLGPTYEGLLP